jgi:hypothetical protein
MPLNPYDTQNIKMNEMTRLPHMDFHNKVDTSGQLTDKHSDNAIGGEFRRDDSKQKFNSKNILSNGNDSETLDGVMS